MRTIRFALVAFLVLLVATSCGPTRPKVVPQKSEVWHWPRNRSQREITSTKKAGQGDLVWTKQHGRALLKWPDLWVRLYDDTELRVETCKVSSDICLALPLGTALNGGESRVKRRINWTTAHVEIKQVATTVMISYHPGTQLTIVRVFDGVVEVRNVAGAVQQTASVGAGEWALVEPRTPPRVSDRLEEMRSLARDLGLWDVFHETEVDVEAGFGPAGSQVPPEDVRVVFGEEEGVEVDAGVEAEETDPDRDGLTNAEEEELGTDPYNPDTDGDDLWDRAEVEEFGTEPLNPDTDADGLPDGREVSSCTDPLAWDTDGDERGDGEEVEWGTDPCDPSDRLPAERDDDGDELVNAQEWELGTDPENPDTDGDGLWDGLEVLEFTTDPLNPDSDEDGLEDSYEVEGCTSPLNPDSDGDGWGDGEELEQGTDPCQPDHEVSALPDLMVEILSIDKREIVWGEQPWTWINYHVCNVGDGDLPANQVYLRAWANGSPKSGYMVVQGPLPPESCREGQFAVGHDGAWPPAEYTVELEVDYGELIEESDEDNNFSNSEQFVVVPSEAVSEITSRIVFVSERTDSPQIWVMDTDGGNQQQLTQEGSSRAPYWSPDNSQILFETDRDGEWGAYIMNADGTGQRPAQRTRRCVSAGYSSLGQLSYACLVDDNWELFVAGKRITYNETDDRFYTWSPLGDRIIFEARTEGEVIRVLMGVDPDGEGLQELTATGYLSWNVDWSPDAERLVFASTRDGNARIFTMLPDGTQWLALTPKDRWSQLPTWSPDGRWITYVSSDKDEVWSLYRIDTIVGRQIRLARYVHLELVPSWSPDGGRLALASNVDGDFEIFVVSVDGRETVQLTRNRSDDYGPQWSH